MNNPTNLFDAMGDDAGSDDADYEMLAEEMGCYCATGGDVGAPSDGTDTAAQSGTINSTADDSNPPPDIGGYSGQQVQDTMNSILGIAPVGTPTGIQMVGPVVSYSGPNDFVNPDGTPGQILAGLAPGSTVASTTFQLQAVDGSGNPVTGDFNLEETVTPLAGQAGDVASPIFPAGGTIYDTLTVPTSLPSTGPLTYSQINEQSFAVDYMDTPGGYIPSPISGTFYQLIGVQNGAATLLNSVQVAPVPTPPAVTLP